ncbi:MAG: YHS domain-containing (seleno)protein [Flavobacteriaceae bacterium]|nr:YHS domain-containing (seleno)protein [Flavobacteriaceae bacterium]
MKNFLILLILATAYTSYAQSSHFYVKDGYAVKGYDIVAYFDNQAVEGNKAKYSYKYEGVLFAFSSLENLNKFKANPEQFLPQYGGHCSYAMATKGSKVSPDPEVFEIRDGKLHLFHRKKGLENWLEEGPEKLRDQADANWAKIIQ